MNRRIMWALALASGVCACASVAPRWIATGPQARDDGVRFTLYAPTATRVQIAGSWPENNWARGDGSAGEANVGLMTDENRDGLWEIVVPLPPGRHQYIFWVDENTWLLDPANPQEVPGGPASTASLVVVVIRDGRYEVR